MRLDVFVHLDDVGKSDQILAKLDQILKKEDKLMATVDDVLAGVQQESSVDDSLITLVQNIKSQLDSIQSGQLPPDVQAKVDQLFSQVQTNIQKVSAAVTANTPAASAPAQQ
jgi:hypothetical protein